ncbi:MAG TPA: GatB/YqeY domain-containing protein [Pseudogracilibacillus sp.]|nr:GatB/YqeY domain-containing protein [Pseudogracilibacillus sp.]
MSLEEQLNQDLKQAMRNKEKVKLSVIRMVKASLQNEAIHLGVDSLSEEEELTILSRELKQRNDSLQEVIDLGRTDLIENLEKEIDILHDYMPQQLSENELEELIKETIAELGVTSKKDFGKVMGALMPKVKGKADGSKVQQLVQQQLS